MDSNIAYESDSELNRAICESNTKSRPGIDLGEMAISVPSTSRGAAIGASSGRRVTPEGNMSADDSHEFSTPAGNPVATSHAPRLGHQMFKNVRRRIHMPPDVIVHPAEPVTHNQMAGEVGQIYSPHPIEAQLAGLLPSPVPSAYIVPTSSGHIPIDRIPAPTRNQAVSAGQSISSSHQQLPTQSPEQRDQVGKVRYRDHRTRPNTIYERTNNSTSESEDENAEVSQNPTKELPPRKSNGRFMKKKK